MAVACEVPVNNWKRFLLEFNGRNYARPVRLESGVCRSDVQSLLAEYQPLIGVELDLKGSEAPAITVALGGLEDRSPQFTHVIRDPTDLSVEEELRGRTVGLNIHSEAEGWTRLIFELGEV
jgi:hypothetical protein